MNEAPNQQSAAGPKPSRRTTIGRRLVTWFLLISVVSCGVLAGILYHASSASLEETFRKILTVIASNKANQLETYALERIRSATALSHAPSVLTATTNLDQILNERLATSAEYRTAEATHRTSLTYFAEAYGYSDLFLISPAGKILFAMKNGLEPGSNLATGPLKDTELAGVLDRVKTLVQTELSDFQIYPGNPEPAAFIASPILREGAVMGILVFQLSNHQIYQVFNDYNGLGSTGETAVGARSGQDVIWVAPLRHDPQAAFKHRIKLGSANSQSIQRAVDGERGYGFEMDYRNIPTLAAWTYVPSFRWGMVVKQDRREALALISQQRNITLGLLALLIVPIALIASIVAASISGPIQFAAKLAEQVATGDLTPHLKTGRNDETGSLLKAIGRMIQNLNNLLSQVKRSSLQLISTANQISSNAKAQERAANDFGSSTNQIAAAAKQISATGLELVRTMGDVSDKVNDTAALANAGKGGLSGMESTMRQLADSTGSISSKLEVISEKAKKINSVVTTITICSHSTPQSKRKKPANTASVFRSSPGKFAGWQTRPQSPLWTLIKW